MTDDANMRLRLQTVAAYRELCRGVRRGGRENVVFALVMLGWAYFSYSEGRSLLFVALCAAFAAGELFVGLFKWAFPSAEGVLLDALLLLAFAGWNIGLQGLAVAVNVRPQPFILFLGLYMLFGAFGRFKAYANLRTLFAERPAAEHLAWFDDLVREIQSSDPDADQRALDLPTSPHWRAKLLGGTAFLVANRGNFVLLLGPDDFTLVREKTDHGTGRRKAMLRVYGEAYPEFELDDASWSNYANWMTERTAQPRPV